MNEIRLLHRYILKPIGEYLLHSSPAPLDAPSAEDWVKIYKLARRNDLAPLVDFILESRGLLTADVKVFAAFQKARRLAVYRTENQTILKETACRILSEKKIPHVPLKGSVIRALYPEPWMRISCDVDVLVRSSDFQTAMQALKAEAGLKESCDTEHDVSLVSESGEKVELHFTLIEKDKVKSASEALDDVWAYVVPGETNPYEGTLPDEVFYYYHIAHLAKHFEIDSCGIRPVLDAWILNRLIGFDPKKRREFLEHGRLKRFADAVEALGTYWFEGGEASETVRELERFILAGRNQGANANMAMAGAAMHKNRFAQTWNRAFLPYRKLKLKYPKLDGHPLRTPVYQIKRLHDAWKEKRSVVKQETSVIWHTSASDRDRTKRLFKDLGL